MAGKLRIAMFGHKRIPSREGGVEVVVEELATRMAALGHSVTCYNRSGHHVSGKAYDGSNARSLKGVRIKKVPTLDKKGLAALTSSFFASLACAFGRYDAVHIHAEGPAAMCLIPKLTGKKVVVTVHGLDWARAKWSRAASAYIKFGERQAVRHADHIIVLSRDVKNYFMETYGRKTIFIPNGATRPERREPDLIRQWGLEKGSYVLFLGRIVPEKGISYLIEAWKGISTDKKLVITGGSSDTEDYMNEMKRLAGDNVIFTGFQQGEVLDELYSNCYIYCLPSDLEGMPLSLLEAMSYGCCCLVSDIPECTEVVGDKAAVFRKGSTADLREKLRELIENEELAEHYRKGAADYILKKYDWDKITGKTLSLYTK